MLTTYLFLGLAAILACALTFLTWFAAEKTPFSRLSDASKRVVIGSVFGLAAILSSHMGISTNGAILNIRDCFPLAAGLFFDPWAGVIAGVIGGVERFIAGTWFDVGSYTTVACSTSTIIAGLAGAALSKILFEGRKPSVFYAVAIGIMIEVFHMLMILLTHMNDMIRAFSVVQAAALPMVTGTSVALGLSALVVGILSGKYRPGIHHLEKSERPITRTFQVWLLVFVTLLFVLTFTFTYVAQNQVTLSTTQSTMALNADDIEKTMDNNAFSLEQAKTLMAAQARSSSRSVANDVTYAQSAGTLSNEMIGTLATEYDIYEIDVIDSTGHITYSTNDAYIGFDMSSGDQSREFLVLLDGKTTDLLQDFQPISFDSSTYVMYAGTAINGGFVQVGYDSTRISSFDSMGDVASAVDNRRIGQDGYALLADSNGTVISSKDGFSNKQLSDLGITAISTNGEDTFNRYTIQGEDSFCLTRSVNGYTLVLVMPAEEAFADRDIFATETFFMYVLLFSALFNLTYWLVKNFIVKNLDKVNASLSRITQGGLDEVVDVRSSAEFTSLSADINTTVATLKHYITEAEERIDAELEFARSIQLSALPQEKKPFPDRHEIDLSAAMFTAKEVGGDFFDYFFIDENRLALVMADVSGKGIPAALFMMKSKTLIKSLTQAGSLSPAKIFELANHELCERNDAEMFVTAWLGILDVRTGNMVCVNAGHEFPAIRPKGEEYFLLHDKHGFVLGGMDGMVYKEYDYHLNRGDEIFLYTDGVTEATSSQEELFGNDRLENALNASDDDTADDKLKYVKSRIDEFQGEAPQFDDITMMCLRFHPDDGPQEPDGPKTLEVDATTDNLEKVQGFVDEVAEGAGADFKALNQIELVVEEVFVNVAHYAYGEGTGPCTIECSSDDTALTMRFIDSGVPYDPLQKKDPDVTLSAEEREIGGLGIYLTKKLMDKVEYERKDERNILTLTKSLAG